MSVDIFVESCNTCKASGNVAILFLSVSSSSEHWDIYWNAEISITSGNINAYRAKVAEKGFTLLNLYNLYKEKKA